jgi:hypothetical protein
MRKDAPWIYVFIGLLHVQTVIVYYPYKCDMVLKVAMFLMGSLNIIKGLLYMISGYPLGMMNNSLMPMINIIIYISTIIVITKTLVVGVPGCKPQI